MDINGKVICGFCTVNLKNLFKTFIEIKIEHRFENGEFKSTSKSNVF